MPRSLSFLRAVSLAFTIGLDSGTVVILVAAFFAGDVVEVFTAFLAMIMWVSFFSKVTSVKSVRQGVHSYNLCNRVNLPS